MLLQTINNLSVSVSLQLRNHEVTKITVDFILRQQDIISRGSALGIPLTFFYGVIVMKIKIKTPEKKNVMGENEK